jgi:uncharacterized protein (DUF2147 family)
MPLRAVLLVVLALTAPVAAAQPLPAPALAYLGDWRAVDEESGEARAVIRLYEQGGRLFGRIVEVLPTRSDPTPDFVCNSCAGELAGIDLREFELLRDLEWQGDEFAGGHIHDPRSGRRYRAAVALAGPDRLRVRGYVGLRAIGRTQVWERAESARVQAGG